MYPSTDIDHWSRIVHQRQPSLSFSWSTFLIAIIGVIIVVLLNVLETVNLESTTGDDAADSLRGEETATEVGRTRLLVKTRELYDDDEAPNFEVANESTSAIHSVANERFELRDFVFYPSHRITTSRISSSGDR
uniref:Uncharacterized protein n=1 Tax=Parascaris equorum TaxID=6256 RepID=A0A914RWK1_PAREQ